MSETCKNLEKESCLTCEFCVDNISLRRLECHRYPPQVLPSYEITMRSNRMMLVPDHEDSGFDVSLTWEENICGEWRKKK